MQPPRAEDFGLPMPQTNRRGFRRWLPGLALIQTYKLSWLYRDFFAGLVLSTMLVPVGIAYAVASGLPGIYGLYATIVPLLVYALLGPSRILVLGPDSSLTAIVLAVVLASAEGDPLKAVTLASMMAIVAGLLCLLAGIARLGFVTELLSKPIRYGYMNGIAITVMISQLPNFFGLPASTDNPINSLFTTVLSLLKLQANWMTLAVGITTIAIIFLLKPFKRVPGLLIAVLIVSGIVGYFDLSSTHHVLTLGAVPQGLPHFSIPWIEARDVIPVLMGGFAIALVSFADTSILSRSYAARHGGYADQNQEMIALGAANLATGFFQGFAVSSSSSRTPIAHVAGAMTQVTGLIGAIVVSLFLIIAPDSLKYLPDSALAAVVLTAAWSLFEISDLKRIYRIQKWEFWLSMFCFASVVTFGVIAGITLAIIVAIIEFLWESWRPHSAILGRVDGLKGYHDITRHAGAKQIPGLLLFRWDAPLFFANAELFQQRLLAAVAKSQGPIKWVVVAAEPVTNLDITASDALAELIKILKQSNIKLNFSEMKDPVKDKLKRFELFDEIGQDAFFPTVGAAVKKFIEMHAVEWKDWEDR